MARWLIIVTPDHERMRRIERYNPEEAEEIRARFVKELGIEKVEVFIDGYQQNADLPLT